MGKGRPISDDAPFKPPEIRDEDICWASGLLKLPVDSFYGEDGTDPRQEALKSMEQIEVAACPGSGKTTLLVAKIAILSEKWRHRTRGICVLSHTNAARHEIETRLGNITVGRRLLSYPHFIGTIHGFVNDYLAVPWLRSRGYPIKMIDTDICLERRWNALPHATRSGLQKNHHGPSVLTVKSPDFGVGEIRWGRRHVLGTGTNTYRMIRDTCQRSSSEGYFCYDELFMWAGELMDKVPGVIEVIRDRFPMLFIDEAQDNSEEQSAILHRIFMAGDGAVIRQRFGDENQAIFDSIGTKEASIDRFPDGKIRKDLPESHRFGQKIADLADPLGIIPSGLKGQGPKKFLASGVSEAGHTILLFGDDRPARVLDAYAELLIETFSGQELREGTFTAVGQVHKDKGDDHAPRHVGHYWPDYDPELAKANPKPQTFIQYICAGRGKAEITGEAYLAVEKVAEGILHLAGMVEGGVTFRRRRYCHRYVLQLLEGCAYVRDRYRDLIDSFVVKREVPTQETWGDSWCSIVREIAEAIAGASLSSPAANQFLAWKVGPAVPASLPTVRNSRDNIYRFSKDGKEVAIRVGSIHSVKGETHMATLVLETFWQDKSGRHNLELLLPWLDGGNSGAESSGMQQQTRLKIHYVAMTRPTHLLCLAMKRSSFENDKGDLDQELVQKLEQHGWQVKTI